LQQSEQNNINIKNPMERKTVDFSKKILPYSGHLTNW